MSIVYILLFLLCLSTLVMIHEAGHLLTAKMFNVYCFEYAVGFGPKLISKKRKNGETYFSLRAIPFGGFVSMYGEEETIPEGLNIDPKRSLMNIKKWKRAIIMLAGIFMNMVLAIVIFFVYEVSFPKYIGHYGHVNIVKDSLAETTGLASGDQVYAQTSSVGDTMIYYDDEATITFRNQITSVETTMKCFFGYDYSTLSIKNTNLNDHLVAYPSIQKGELADGEDTITFEQILSGAYDASVDYRISGFVNAIGIYETKVVDETKQIFVIEISENYDSVNDGRVLLTFNDFDTVKDNFNYICKNGHISVSGKISKDLKENSLVSVNNSDFKFNVPDYENDTNLFIKKAERIPEKISFSIYKFSEHSTGRGEPIVFDNQLLSGDSSYRFVTDPGISMQLESFRTGFGESIKNTFTDFADSATVIGKSLGQLFTNADSWKDVGGIIAIGVVTTRTLQESGFGPFLYYWALISVNLGIVNLLPFPGLDGWHFLVTVIEGITRKEIPQKFKTIMSAIGMIILFSLMILIVIKDVVRFI